MYFEFEDHHPDTPRLESSFSRRESVVYSVAVHLLLLLGLIYVPQLSFVREAAERARLAALERQRMVEQQQRENATFVFVQPRVDTPAPMAPPRAELSDRDRVARSVERRPDATSPLPYARGNSTERVEAQEAARARGQGPGPDPAAQAAPGAGNGHAAQSPPLVADGRPTFSRPDSGGGGPANPGGSLGEALRNLQRYVQRESFDNPRGGGEYGPFIQFDTKGVEFGPWIRRFVAQIKRNWFIPYAAMSFKGHVVLTFNVHKDGTITDVSILQPSSVDAFNSSAFNAVLASNPTQPLPPEYPADTAFFTVTFFYNETPPSQ
jgi:TonB family protein